MSETKLFTPLKIRGVEFSNRMFIPPMDMYSADKDGNVTDNSIGWYADYAHRGFAGIIQEATAVSPEGRISPHDLGIWSDDKIEGLKRIVNVVHFCHSKIGVQLAHAGRKGSTYAPGASRGRQTISVEDGGWKLVAPSAEAYNEYHDTPQALTKEEIEEKVNNFKDAARRAVSAGYDFVEIHAAHGYLIHEFLSPLSNKRTDEFGGSFENRSRFLKMIATAIRDVIPAEMPLFVRVSMSDMVKNEGWNMDETALLCEELTKNYGVDIMDLSNAGLSASQVIPAEWDAQIMMANEIVKKTGIHVASVGGIYDAKSASRVVDEYNCDIVLIGRAALRHAFNPRSIAVDLNQPIPPYPDTIWWATNIPSNCKY